jgi:hypothetical protein
MRSRLTGWVAVALAALVMGNAAVSFAGQDFGQPAPLGRLNEFSWGFGYHDYRSEWKTDDREVRAGEFRHGDYWIQVAYTFIENWELCARFGVANLKIDTLFSRFDPPGDFEADYGFNLTLGLKGLLYGDERRGLGPVLQANFYSDYEAELKGTLRDDLGGEAADILARYKGWRDINLGLAAQVYAGPLVLYGGGFAYWATADGHMEVARQGEGPETYDATVDEKGNFGGYFGTMIPFGRAWSFYAEGQYRSDLSFSVALTQKMGAYFD